MPLLPMSTTEHLPPWNMEVAEAWLVSGTDRSLKCALHNAGAVAVIGVSIIWTGEYVCVGTAVIIL